MGKKKLAVIDDSIITEEKDKKIKENTKKEAAKVAEEEAVAATEANMGVEENASGDSQDQQNVIAGDSEAISNNEKIQKQVQDDNKEDKKVQPKKKKASKMEKKARKTRGKKYQDAREKVERNKLYPINEATELIKETSYSKFDGTLEIHINTNQKGVRGLIALPFASGKKLRIMAFGKGAEESGADIVGDDNQLNEIAKGKINFDVLVTTADWMPKLARAAKVLGPKGLMPNPKNGTITTDLKRSVDELQGGKVEYKTENKANVIHLGIGKVSQPTEELNQNIRLLLATIGKTRIKKAVISPTMGPGIKLDLSSI